MSGLTKHTFDLTKLLTGTYYCTGCAGRVCEGAEALEGVASAACNLEEGKLEVSFDPGVISLHELESSVARLALEAADRVGHAAYRITGLD